MKKVNSNDFLKKLKEISIYKWIWFSFLAWFLLCGLLSLWIPSCVVGMMGSVGLYVALGLTLINFMYIQYKQKKQDKDKDKDKK